MALFFEGEPGDAKVYTYLDLLIEVKKAANVLIKLGIQPGDRVAIYMPMIPEAIIAMQAVARVGAVHSVIFGGFSADSLASRIQDAEAKLVITADGGYRKGKASLLKPAVDEALADNKCPTVENVLVVNRTDSEVAWVEGRDLWWEEQLSLVDREHIAQGFNAEHPLFILYTSGTTGKPKGILHTTGGYLTQAAYTHKNVFDLHEGQDVYWCTADVGWITGHIVRCIWTPCKRRYPGDLRGNSRFSRLGKMVGHRSEVPREYPLHSPYCNSQLYEDRPQRYHPLRPKFNPRAW